MTKIDAGSPIDISRIEISRIEIIRIQIIRMQMILIGDHPIDTHRRRRTDVRIARDIIETHPRRHAAPSIRHRSRLESAKWNPLDPHARVRE